jgi:hypothetical protein
VIRLTKTRRVSIFFASPSTHPVSCLSRWSSIPAHPFNSPLAPFYDRHQLVQTLAVSGGQHLLVLLLQVVDPFHRWRPTEVPTCFDAFKLFNLVRVQPSLSLYEECSKTRWQDGLQRGWRSVLSRIHPGLYMPRLMMGTCSTLRRKRRASPNHLQRSLGVSTTGADWKQRECDQVVADIQEIMYI